MNCCDLSAGKMRHLIDIKSPTRTTDGGGGSAITLTTVASNVRAMLRPASANEQMFAGRLEHRITHKMWTRYRTDIASNSTVIYKDRELQVRGIVNVEERDRWLEVSLEEGVAL